jgi:membrane dipeptidase
MTLTHTRNTGWADSSNDEPKWDGLNDLGRKIVLKMNKLGMAIDISHCSDKTVKDVLEISQSPVMASHSCARSLCDIPRNLSDDLISKIASNNGYIGVNFFPLFLSQKIYDQALVNLKKYENWYKEETNKNKDDPDMLNRLEPELYDKMLEGTDKVDMSVLIDHISHIIDIGGIDCVGLGSDFDGINTTPIDLTDVSCYPALINELLNRGFNKNEVRKIMGINLYKFLKKI